MKAKLLTVFAVLLLAVASVAADSYATPDSPETISSGAAIEEGVGTNPVVEYEWVLPDESSAEGTQVEIVPSGERCDIYSCLVVGDAESRDTIMDVFVDVYHPDETFKYQVHATKLDVVSEESEIRECIDNAVSEGLISSADATEIKYNIFSQPNWYMYKVHLPMYYHQPAGWYDALGYAVDSTSRLSTPYPGKFEWVAGTYLELDFSSVNFGNIQPGAWKVLNGDMDMKTPEKPTLKNEGNTEVKVGVEFSDFVGTGALPNKKITTFDAQLRSMVGNYLDIPGEHREFNSNELVWFEHPISLCRQEKIDFSIHADIGTVPDEYSGTVTIYAEPEIVRQVPKDEDGRTLEFPAEGMCLVGDSVPV